MKYLLVGTDQEEDLQTNCIVNAVERVSHLKGFLMTGETESAVVLWACCQSGLSILALAPTNQWWSMLMRKACSKGSASSKSRKSDFHFRF
jgi:hypothetical protein